MQVCAQRNRVATEGRLFPSDSSDRVYKVTAFREDEWPFCNCMGFIMRRKKNATAEGTHPNETPGSCKHTEIVFKETCDWKQETDEQYQFDGLCPKCHGPLVEEGDQVLPEDPTHAVDDLRSVLADLAGEEAPAPLPKPTPHEITFTQTVTRTVIVDALDPAEATAIFEKDSDDWIGQSVFVDESRFVVSAVPYVPKRKPRKKAPTAAKAAPRTRKADITDLVKGAGK